MTPVDLEGARKVAREAQERAKAAEAARSGMMTRDAYEGRVQGDLAWLESMPSTTERAHLALIARVSGGLLYDRRADVPDLAALVLAMADRIAWLESEVRNHRVARNL